ncbi:MAG TPA: hypothetical protein VFN81_09750 [Sphingomicrobium sp.]|nr:hypothetical protein [Sphingomicrobium sp.]
MDINYLFLRQQIERSRAEAAESDIARRIHEQMADEYERLIADATGGRVTFAHVPQATVAPPQT